MISEFFIAASLSLCIPLAFSSFNLLASFMTLALEKVVRLGYLQHIECLMVVGAVMMMLDVHPREAYLWFMEMFIDSDWMMTPNVYGMALLGKTCALLAKA